MSQQQNPVPRLDLAPKLKRPLSLWNPLDYLRLLYWVFFFPQALQWYVDTFGGGYIPEKEINWIKLWDLLRHNSIQRQLFIQGFVLSAIAPLTVSIIFQRIGVPLNWSNVWLGILGGVASSAAFSLVAGIAGGVASSVAFSLGVGVTSSAAIAVALSVAVGTGSLVSAIEVYKFLDLAMILVAIGFTFAVTMCVVFSMPSRIAIDEPNNKTDYEVLEGRKFVDVTPLFILEIVALALLWLVSKLLFGDVAAIAIRIATIIAVIIACFVAIFRPENWLFGLAIALQRNRRWQFPHVTPIPILSLSSRLTDWLRRDWETGVYNVNQLLAYTLQFIPVIQAVNRVLEETPLEQVIFRVAQLAQAPHKWRLIYSASATFRATINLYEDTETRLDTPAHAAAAGFWYLYRKNPAKATEAFAVVRSLPYGEEMFTLADSLAIFYDAKDAVTIADIQLPALPKKPLFRETTWGAIASLHRVIEDIRVVDRSVSRSTRSFALNRALGELTNIFYKAETLPQAERAIVANIAQTWKEILLRMTGEVGEISIAKPIRNPYVIGDPVQGKLFVGREDVMRQLEELWILGNQLQSVVLFGHRRMGKTSILLNAARCLGSSVKLAYVNLLRVGNCSQGVAEVLMAMSDSISEVVNLPPPADADLRTLPYRTFERYLKQVETNLGESGLIVALDEFEQIEVLIEAEKIPQDFMGVLRGMVQMSPKIAFALAGLHTLEEMSSDYFQPFFASVIPMHVGFMERGATRQILANPDEDFLLDYMPSALDLIYDLTFGQPYLVQLIGFQLVRRYNEQVFEMGRTRNPLFTIEDVEAIVNEESEFFKRGRHYFDGVWGQAARGATGQQAIIKVLAANPEGLSLSAIALTTTFDEPSACEAAVAAIAALNNLQRHDVVVETEGRWRITVELFRRWVVQQ